MDQFFAAAEPEAVGISSRDVLGFMRALEEHELCMHSIIIVRAGKMVVESYYAPYQRETLHRMFSITKSFTSLAVGLLADEGRISLDDPIAAHFPEKLPEKVHPYIAQTRIQDMLMMASAHRRTTFSGSPERDWVRTFFTVEPSHLPGTVFSYDTSSSHTLAALVEKLAGMPLLDYLRVKFLDDIGFSEDAHIIPDPMGISMGGSGLVARPLDLAKVAWIVLRKGEHQGRQYLPREYIEAASSKQIDTWMRGANIEERQGYGYQFWRTRHNGFAMYGIGGQIAACYPDYDLLLVTTADTQEHPYGVPLIYEAFYNHILKRVSDRPLPPDPKAYAELESQIDANAVKPLSGIDDPGLAAAVNHKQYVFPENALGLKRLRLDLAGSEGILCYENGTGSHKLPFGVGRLVEGRFPHYRYRCGTSGAWLNESTFVIKSHIIDDELGMITIQLAFLDDAVTVVMKKVIGSGFQEFNGFASGFLS